MACHADRYIMPERATQAMIAKITKRPKPLIQRHQQAQTTHQDCARIVLFTARDAPYPRTSQNESNAVFEAYPEFRIT